MVHALAGDGVDRAHARGRPPARLGAGTVPLPRPRHGRGARARPVRAADGGRRDGVPCARSPTASSSRSGRSSSHTSSSTSPSWYASSARTGAGSTSASGTRPPRSARGGCDRFRAVTLPLLGPALASAASIVFLFCFTSFGVIVVLGGIRYATLESEIYNQAARLFDLRTAAALALLQLAAVAATVSSPGGSSGASQVGAEQGDLRPGPRGGSASPSESWSSPRSRCSHCLPPRSSSGRCASVTATGSITSRHSRARRPRSSLPRGTRS